MPKEWRPSTPNATDRRLLLQLGIAMISGGMAVYDVEEELRRVGYTLGHAYVQPTATPTGVWVSLAQGEAASLAVVSGPLRLDQSNEVNRIRRAILSGTIAQEQALDALAHVRDIQPRFPAWMSVIGAMTIAGGITALMQPAWYNILVAGFLGVIVHGLIVLSGRHKTLANLLPTVAAFVVAAAVFSLWRWGGLVGPLRTVITPLAILLPGATLSTGMAELATGSMVAGSSRFVYGVTQLLLMAAGILGAGYALGVPLSIISDVQLHQLGWISVPIALIGVATGMAVQESIPPSIVPYSLGNLVLTFFVQYGSLYEFHLGAVSVFLGALSASFVATVIDALKPEAARLVVFLPSFWLLVPGSLGLIGIAQIGADSAGFTAFVSVVGLILMIALGLLVGSTLGRPAHRIAREHGSQFHAHVPTESSVTSGDASGATNPLR